MSTLKSHSFSFQGDGYFHQQGYTVCCQETNMKTGNKQAKCSRAFVSSTRNQNVRHKYIRVITAEMSLTAYIEVICVNWFVVFAECVFVCCLCVTVDSLCSLSPGMNISQYCSRCASAISQQWIKLFVCWVVLFGLWSEQTYKALGYTCKCKKSVFLYTCCFSFTMIWHHCVSFFFSKSKLCLFHNLRGIVDFLNLFKKLCWSWPFAERTLNIRSLKAT